MLFYSSKTHQNNQIKTSCTNVPDAHLFIHFINISNSSIFFFQHTSESNYTRLTIRDSLYEIPSARIKVIRVKPIPLRGWNNAKLREFIRSSSLNAHRHVWCLTTGERWLVRTTISVVIYVPDIRLCMEVWMLIGMAM